MNIYVGNLSYGMTDRDLEGIFAEYGSVKESKVIKDRETGRSRGFGFVEMENDSEGQSAIDGLDGSEVDGRSLIVNVARPKEGRQGRARY